MGAFTLVGAVADCSVVSSAGTTNTFVVSFGTAAAGDDATLTGTEVDIIPSTTLNTTGGTVLTNTFDAVLAASAVFDGTAGAKDIYANFAIADIDMTAANSTNVLSGVLTLIMTVPVINQ